MELGIPVARSYNSSNINDMSITQLRGLDLENEEGFVVRFSTTGERVKLKFSTYVNNYRVASAKYKGNPLKNALEFLINDPDDRIENHLDNIPDEFFEEAKRIQDVFLAEYSRAEKAFDEYVEVFKDTELKNVPAEIPYKGVLCKYLQASRHGKATREDLLKIKREYAICCGKNAARKEMEEAPMRY